MSSHFFPFPWAGGDTWSGKDSFLTRGARSKKIFFFGRGGVIVLDSMPFSKIIFGNLAYS